MSSDSTLLQQAIIDATALKEAAIKNAENALVEKYSYEFKQTVQKLLEQEEAALTNPAIPQAPPADQQAMAGIPEDPTQQMPTADLQKPESDAFSKIKSAFLDGPEDEVITIEFDKLKNNMMEALGHEDTLLERDIASATETIGMDALAPGAPMESEEKILEFGEELDQELEEEQLDEEELADFELDEGDMEEMASTEGEQVGVPVEEQTAVDPQTAMKKAELLKRKGQLDKEIAALDAGAAQKQADVAKASAETTEESPAENVEEGSIEISEEELMELEEQLTVDLKPESQSRGYMGTTTVEKQLLHNVELAAARDDNATEKREEEMERLSDLVKENNSLKAMNNKMMLMLETLKKEVQKVNVSNAKLLYTNKALANISLNERQKNQIVESISKADSVLAAKTIYETVQNAVENVSVKEAPQSLRETLNRASTPYVAKKSSANNLSDFMAERMKALAGIKNNK